MNIKESACSFQCQDFWLYGIISIPKQTITSTKGVLIIAGGPQYRAGSHRQFTLLARHLAAKGIPVMRFDIRGMGDSEGEIRTFEKIDEDFDCAINQFFLEIPSLQEIVIWGLCDAASAALFYAHHDKRVTGLVLLNPWVRTENSAVKTYLKHYYSNRFTDPELWKKVCSGDFNYIVAIRSLLKLIYNFLISKNKSTPFSKNISCNQIINNSTLPERMFNGFNRFKGKILLITCGNDLTAQEFMDLIKGSKKWQNLLESSSIKQFHLPNANHTFSRREWRDQVYSWTYDWINSW